MIDDMVFSDKGSQDGDEYNDKVLDLAKTSNNDPRMSIFSMSKASTVDTNNRSCQSGPNDESDFGFRSNSTVFKNYDPSNNRSNTVQNR